MGIYTTNAKPPRNSWPWKKRGYEGIMLVHNPANKALFPWGGLAFGYGGYPSYLDSHNTNLQILEAQNQFRVSGKIQGSEKLRLKAYELQ